MTLADAGVADARPALDAALDAAPDELTESFRESWIEDATVPPVLARVAAAIRDNDLERFKAFVPDSLIVLGRAVPRDEVLARAAEVGLRAYTGIAQLEDGESEMWRPIPGQVVDKADRYGVAEGSGYGVTRIAWVARDPDGAWRVVELEDVDLGAP